MAEIALVCLLTHNMSSLWNILPLTPPVHKGSEVTSSKRPSVNTLNEGDTYLTPFLTLLI